MSILIVSGCTGNISDTHRVHELDVSRYNGPIARVGMGVYLWQTMPDLKAGPTGPHYKVVFNEGDMGQGPGAITWITGDVDGDNITDVIQPWSNLGRLGLIVYSGSDSGVYSNSWDNSNMGEGAGALVWLKGWFDTNDARTDIIQLWNNEGRLGIIVYESNGTGFVRSWRDTVDVGVGALAWLTGDVDGDRRTDIIQPWNNDGRLGIIVHRSTGEEYEILQHETMTEGPGAVAWKVGRINNDSFDDLVQLWNNNGRLSYIVYLSNGRRFVNSGIRGNLEEGPGAIEWLTGDINDDNLMDIIQLWDNDGKLGMIAYQSNGEDGYSKAWHQNAKAGVGALAWLTGEVSDDSRLDIIQPWDKNGKLSYIVHALTETGGTLYSHSHTNMESDNLRILAGRANDDAFTDMIHLWKNVNGTYLSISNDDVDRILENATDRLIENNGQADVPCRVVMQRKGSVGVFSEGDGTIDTEDELDEVLGVDSHVKVVADINFCNDIGLNIMGCADVPGDSMVVVQSGAVELDGVLWAHELGHNQGLPHRDEDTAFYWHAEQVDGLGGADFVQAWKNQGRLAIDTHVWNGGASAFRLLQNNEELGAGAGAVALFQGDVNNDDRADIVQAWNNNGRLALKLYTASVVGYGGPWSETTNERPEAVAWLIADSDGDAFGDIVQAMDDAGRLLLVGHRAAPPGFEMSAWSTLMPNASDSLAWFRGNINGNPLEDIIQVRNESGNLQINVYELDNSEFKTISSANISRSSDALAWLSGDYNDDAELDIIQVWNNNGRVAMRMYTFENGQFELSDESQTAQGIGALRWFAGNFNSDSRTDIIQIWNNNGRVAFIVYLSDGDDFVAGPRSTTNEGAGAKTWLANDFDNDGDLDIMQVWANTSDEDLSTGAIFYRATDDDGDNAADEYRVAWRTGRLLPGPNAIMNRSVGMNANKVNSRECTEFLD